MSLKNRLNLICQKPTISWFDLIVLILLLTAGFIYLHDYLHWGVGYVGDTAYGDAQFWWSGALHISQGIFQDNPGKGFRPGYFILTGLTLPILGQQFQYYYTYFLIAFLMSSSLLYLALRQIFGKWSAACIIAMLVFNPFTAEWLATSTTDGTGLLLHISALACLLIGIYNGLHRSWLIAFGILFSLATLTRPLVTPFIGIALLALLILPKTSFKKRFHIFVCVLLAFSLPTFLWMGIQKLTIDRWSLSTNDMSAFYAASDPNIQVWNGSMYNDIRLSAAKHFNIKPDKISDPQINTMFLLTTINNYINNSTYHLHRLIPHLVNIASFSPSQATHGTNFWRTIFLELVAGGIVVDLLLQYCWLRASILIGIAVLIYQIPSFVTIMTLVGATLGLALPFTWKNRDLHLGIFLLSTYWLIGVMALYFVGGTWGTPSFSAIFALNALGYRLGSQFFFVGDLLACYSLFKVAYFKLNPSKLYHNKNWIQTFFIMPRPIAGKIVLIYFTTFLTSMCVVYILGTYIVLKRTYARNHSPIEFYPALEPVINFYRKQSTETIKQAKGLSGGLDSDSTSLLIKGKYNLLLTGTVSPFIWNLPGQKRSQLMIHTQDQVRPYTLGPSFLIIEAPEHIQASDWIGKQGAFIIHADQNNHNVSNLPYYITTPALRAFVPLSQDGSKFLFNKTIWFPLVKNATQLETSHALQFKNTKITWSNDSGNEPFMRRLFLTPKKEKEKIQLILNLASNHKPFTLEFSYSIDPILATLPAASAESIKDPIEIVTISHNGSKHQHIASIHKTPHSDAPLKKIEIPIRSDADVVEITFNHLTPGKGVWIYEFNLQENNFVL
jgi:hypothetical protein